MGLQEISERKVRKASVHTGLPLIRAMRHSNNLWFGWVRESGGHWHVTIDPADWDWEYEPGCQFSSCAHGTHGPSVTPSAEIVEQHAHREQEREAERERKNVEATAFIQTWTEKTQKWLESEEAPTVHS